MHHRHRRLLPAALALVLWGLSCHGGGGPPYHEVQEPRVTCLAPTLRSGGLNQAVDPGTTCLAPPRASALPAAGVEGPQGVVDLGPHAVGEVVTFDVPPGTASLMLLEQLVSGGPANQQVTVTFTSDGSTMTGDNVAVIGELHDPSGRLIYTDLEVIAATDASAELLFAQGSGAVVGAASYPSTSAGLQAVASGGVASGTWSVLVNDYAHECWLAAQPDGPPGLTGPEGISCPVASQANDAVYRLYALTTPAAAGGSPRASATLDVAFHLVDAPTPIIGIDAAHAPTDPSVRRMVESFGWLLSGAGVCLGTVTFYDEPAWARVRFATGTSADGVGPCSNLSQLLATSVPGQRTLELFLVPRLSGSSIGSSFVLGVDGTVPGPATVNGTIASGAVVSAEDLGSGSCPAPGAPGQPRPEGCGSDLVAYIAAHEAGHYLGLYHPTEGDGSSFDPIADTPHCECSSHCGLSPATCKSNGLPATRCAGPDARCGGGPNLMFWLISQVSAGYLSPDQANLVRSSPVLRSP